MAHVRTTTWPVLSTTAIATLQTVGGQGSFVLNGALVSHGSVTFDGYCRTISFTSANNLNGGHFTITGYVNGALTTEDVTGPDDTTVYSTNYYSSVTGITSSADAANVSVGTGTTGYINWFMSDFLSTVANLTIAVTAIVTINYTFQVTLDEVNNGVTTKVFAPNATMTDATASQIINYTAPSRYVRILINSSDATGTLTASFLQQGVR